MFFPFKLTTLVFLPPFSALINNISAMGMEEKQVPYYPSLESLIAELVCHGNKNILRSITLKAGALANFLCKR